MFLLQKNTGIKQVFKRQLSKAPLIFLVLFIIAYHTSAQVEEIKFFKRTNEFAGARVLDNGKILFSAQDDEGNAQLWVTDGTASGTKQLSDHCPSSTFTSFYSPYSSNYGFYSNGRDYISIMNTGCSSQILKAFKTDGNNVSYSNQTNKDFSYGFGSSANIYDSISIGDKIYFFTLGKRIFSFDKNTYNITEEYKNNDKYPEGNDDVRYIGKDGDDLILYFWNPHILVRFNTINKTVSQFFDIKQYYQDALGYDAKPAFNYAHNQFMMQKPNIYSWNGSNYFIVTYQEKDIVTSHALWKTDGTAAGTVELHRFTRGKTNIDRALFFTPFNGKLYFRFSDKTNSGLWMTDGTAQGTSLVKALNTDTNFHNADNVMSSMAVVNNKLYFFGLPAASQDYELFESDGTAAGTRKAFEFIPGPSGLMERNNTLAHIYTHQNRLYWMTSFFYGGGQIMTTDGTIDGTYSLGGGFSRSISPMVFNNDYAYFSGQVSGGYALNKVAIGNPSPLLLSSVSGNITKGSTITVTGFDLKGATRVDLFLPDGSWDSYGLGQNLQQINDTAISFGVSQNISLSSFRIAVSTPQGTFLSRQEYTIGTGTSIAEEAKERAPFSISQSPDQAIITFHEAGKNYETKMVDMTGKVIETRFVQNGPSLVLDKKQYKPGVYILQINNIFAGKIVVW